EQGPGMDLFRTLRLELGDMPIVAEDLGEMFPSVRRLLAESGFPGMKVLQFAFNGQDNVDLPHNYPRNCVAYPGTHDNNTLAGWYAQELGNAGRKQAREYFALTEEEGVLRGLLRGVLASPAALAVIPMADWLEEPSSARMNTPGSPRGNWQWRAEDKALTPALAREIRALTARYFRAEPAAKRRNRDAL
ncbi:MAG: 4-alpha-glucanotransferase, partial [Blautia massiliensis (ex Durand et al. 2017)]